MQAEQAMDAVSALVADLDVTDVSPQDSARHTAAHRSADATEPEAENASRGGTGKTAQDDKVTVTAYRRVGKQPAAVAAAEQQPKSKPAADAKTGTAAASQAAAHSPSNSRPARQRGKAQPYWMGGASAPASSPAPKADPAASDAVLACPEGGLQLQNQAHGNDAKAGKVGKSKKGAVAKRQTRTLPHKEQQEQPVKRPRTAAKVQQDQQLQREAEAAQAGIAEAVQMDEQPADSSGGAETEQAGGPGGAHAVGLGHQEGDGTAGEQARMVKTKGAVQQTDAVSLKAAPVLRRTGA